MKGILGRKVGMTRIISEESRKMIPVTVLEVPVNIVLQVKTKDVDGYDAVVLGAFERKNFGKNENQKYKFIQEVLIEGGTDLKKGDSVSVASLQELGMVKVSGVSKGRGFSGVIKRHNFQRGKETHGSHHHREPGSVGMCAKPGRILRGKKMPGQYGNESVTLRSVEIVEVDVKNNLIALKGALPGAINSFLFLRG